jgi:hypothetical protein
VVASKLRAGYSAALEGTLGVLLFHLGRPFGTGCTHMGKQGYSPVPTGYWRGTKVRRRGTREVLKGDSRGYRGDLLGALWGTRLTIRRYFWYSRGIPQVLTGYLQLTGTRGCVRGTRGVLKGTGGYPRGALGVPSAYVGRTRLKHDGVRRRDALLCVSQPQRPRRALQRPRSPRRFPAVRPPRLPPVPSSRSRIPSSPLRRTSSAASGMALPGPCRPFGALTWAARHARA